jgi:hypothetical protein
MLYRGRKDYITTTFLYKSLIIKPHISDDDYLRYSVFCPYPYKEDGLTNAVYNSISLVRVVRREYDLVIFNYEKPFDILIEYARGGYIGQLGNTKIRLSEYPSQDNALTLNQGDYLIFDGYGQVISETGETGIIKKPIRLISK